MDEKTKRLQLYLPESVKSDLEDMAKETGLSQNQLAVLALQSLLANYKLNGTNIFAKLLDVGKEK
ncbi:hypothetical protein [Bacillus sp. AFS040349]|uniref:hypothetical protein n=1 Tax=Bacillus sp. AFS040349 TaxID=2033502 RepID=UPI000BFBFBC4|nr:hypothetical protein [Bacillus sp. AFS040349]PGT83234.1 hypothetical protein COD11_12935 [Bacillus sp. AFS040349]